METGKRRNVTDYVREPVMSMAGARRCGKLLRYLGRPLRLTRREASSTCTDAAVPSGATRSESASPPHTDPPPAVRTAGALTSNHLLLPAERVLFIRDSPWRIHAATLGELAQHMELCGRREKPLRRGWPLYALGGGDAAGVPAWKLIIGAQLVKHISEVAPACPNAQPPSDTFTRVQTPLGDFECSYGTQALHTETLWQRIRALAGDDSTPLRVDLVQVVARDEAKGIITRPKALNLYAETRAVRFSMEAAELARHFRPRPLARFCFQRGDKPDPPREGDFNRELRQWVPMRSPELRAWIHLTAELCAAPPGMVRIRRRSPRQPCPESPADDAGAEAEARRGGDDDGDEAELAVLSGDADALRRLHAHARFLLEHSVVANPSLKIVSSPSQSWHALRVRHDTLVLALAALTSVPVEQAAADFDAGGVADGDARSVVKREEEDAEDDDEEKSRPPPRQEADELDTQREAAAVDHRRPPPFLNRLPAADRAEWLTAFVARRAMGGDCAPPPRGATAAAAEEIGSWCAENTSEEEALARAGGEALLATLEDTPLMWTSLAHLASSLGIRTVVRYSRDRRAPPLAPLRTILVIDSGGTAARRPSAGGSAERCHSWRPTREYGRPIGANGVRLQLEDALAVVDGVSQLRLRLAVPPATEDTSS